MKKHHKEKAYFKQFLFQKGLSNTIQRDLIVDTFFSINKHISAEELHKLVKNKDRKIGLTTVYRTLELLTEAGLATVRYFENGCKVYEHLCFRKGHHDHLVCSHCGKIIEFFSPKIERFQNELAKKEGFKLTSHRHVMFGLCPKCRKFLEKDKIKGYKLLSEIEKPCRLKFVFSKIHGRKIIERLNAMGVYPDSIIEFVGRIGGGPILIKVMDTEISVGRGICSKILVKEVK